MGLAVALLSTDGYAIYTFTSIADTTGAFNVFTAPALNAHGLVAFRAELDTPGQTGIWVGDSVAITKIADNSTAPFNAFSLATPAINAEGTVAFAASRVGMPAGVFLGNGGAIDTYAVAVGGVGINSLGRPSINDKGDIAFRGTHTLVPAGQVYAAVFANLTSLASSSGSFQNFGNGNAEIDINESGVVAFSGMLDTNVKGIYASSVGQAVVTVADSTTQFIDFTHSSPSINAEGDVAFHATLTGGGQGIFIGSAAGGGVTTYVDHTGPFSTFAPVTSINAHRDVAFSAFLDGGRSGLFTGTDPVADQVIANGDPLFGSTINEIVISNASLNDAGLVAFRYSLADGRRGIALATPITGSNSADFDLDIDVDGADFLIWQRGFGILGTATLSQGDANGDLDVDSDDLAVWGQQFGSGPAIPSNAPIPEPTTSSLLLIAAATCIRARLRVAELRR